MTLDVAEALNPNEPLLLRPTLPGKMILSQLAVSLGRRGHRRPEERRVPCHSSCKLDDSSSHPSMQTYVKPYRDHGTQYTIITYPLSVEAKAGSLGLTWIKQASFQGQIREKDKIPLLPQRSAVPDTGGFTWVPLHCHATTFHGMYPSAVWFNLLLSSLPFHGTIVPVLPQECV